MVETLAKKKAKKNFETLAELRDPLSDTRAVTLRKTLNYVEGQALVASMADNLVESDG